MTPKRLTKVQIRKRIRIKEDVYKNYRKMMRANQAKAKPDESEFLWLVKHANREQREVKGLEVRLKRLEAKGK